MHLLSLHQPSVQRWSAVGHHAAPRPWPSRVPSVPRPAPQAAQPWGPAAAQQQRHAASLCAHTGAAQPAEQPSPVMDPAAAAYLEQHGISTAQLQQEQPAAAAALTLPLAQLLVRAVTARQGQKNTHNAARLAERLVFLASEAGVPEDVLRKQYVGNPAYLRFKLNSVRELLAWLRDNLPDGTLQRVAAWNPGIWHSLQPALAAAKANMQQMFGLSDSGWAAAVHNTPSVLAGFTQTTAGEVVRWLRSDAVGMPERRVVQLFKRQPLFFLLKPSRLSGLLDYLLRRLHIERDKAATLVFRNINAFGCSRATLESKVEAMERYGFSASEVGRIALNVPISLGCNFDDQILPVLLEVEQLLTGHLPDMPAEARRAAVISVVLRGGSLIISRPAKLQGNFEFLRSRGLSPEEARAVLQRRPQLFQGDMHSEGFADKLRYYESELGIPETEMLVEHGGYLKEGLAKVDQRVFCMERRGQLQRLTLNGEASSLAWMVDSTDMFLERFGVGLEEWEAAEAEWASSERALRYGLVGKAGRRGFETDPSRSSAALKAANARRRNRQ